LALGKQPRRVVIVDQQCAAFGGQQARERHGYRLSGKAGTVHWRGLWTLGQVVSKRQT
jgi:ribosomal protein L2